MKAIAIVRPPPPRKPAFVLRFMAWAARVPEPARADAASALARAYLHSGLPDARRAEIAAAMAALLDDPSANVRRAISHALSGARDAPRAIVVALANDDSDVAEPILLRSPLLSGAELADRVIAGDATVHCAVARRPGLSPIAACALAEAAAREPILALLGNLDANLPSHALRRIHARLGDDSEVRAALAARPGLAATLRAEIALADSEGHYAASEGALAGRAARDRRDAALVRIAAECGGAELPELARFLRARGALTLALLLRSLLTGERGLVAAALAELSGAPYARADALTRGFAGEGFAALAFRAGLSRNAVAALRAALSALRTHGPGNDGPAIGEGPRPDLVGATIAACEARRDPALAPAIALLWRFAAEAAKRDARATACAAFSDRARLPPALDFSPANDARPLLLTAGIRSTGEGEGRDAAVA